MPYSFKKSGKKVKVVKKENGKVVATSKTMKGAKGYAFHASKDDKGKKKFFDIDSEDRKDQQ